VVQLGPFGSSRAAGPWIVVWVVAWLGLAGALALRGFVREDL